MFNTLTVRTWDLMLPRPSRVLVTNPDRQLPCHFSKTVLRIPSKWELPVFRCLHDELVLPATRQTPFGLPRCSSRQGSPDRMPVPDVRWLHRDTGKCLWTFSFCSNAHSFGLPLTAYNGPVCYAVCSSSASADSRESRYSLCLWMISRMTSRCAVSGIVLRR